MSASIANVGEVCPFTLELCEDCCVKRISNHREICFFTLEPCCFHVTGGHRGDRNTMTVSKEKRSCIRPAVHTGIVREYTACSAGADEVDSAIVRLSRGLER